MFTFPLCQFSSSGGSPYIRSVQPVAITIPVGAASATATINSVNTSLAVPFYNGTTTTVAGVLAGACNFATRVELTNATTVTAYRQNASATDTVTAAVTVVEFLSTLVQNVQLGTITSFGSAPVTITISGVDTTRSAVVWLGCTSNSSNNNTGFASGITLSSATTLTTMGQAFTTTMVHGYAVIQFQSAVLSSLEQRAPTYNDSSLSETDTLSTGVDTTRSILLYGGVAPPNATTLPGAYAGMTLSGSNSVTLVRKTASPGLRGYSYAVVQFAPGVLKSLQRGLISFGVSDTVISATVTPVNTKQAFVNWVSGEFNGGSSGQNSECHTLVLTGTATVTSTQNTASGLTSNHEWELVEFT